MAADLDIVGTAGVDVVPIAPNFHAKLQAIVLPGADKIGDELGRIIGNAMGEKIAKAVPKALSDGAKLARADAIKQGSSTGGAFADSLRAKLTAAFRAMPKLDIGLSDVGVDAQLARLRAKLEDLRNRRIGIDISAEDANAKITAIDERLARLGASSPNVAVKVDVATARAALAEIQAEIAEASRSPLDIRVRVGQFRETLLAQVEAAQATLPAIQIDADTSSARAELDRYRAELAVIPARLRTDLDFDDAAAVARIEELRVKLAELSRNRRVDVDVRADAARAEAELATIGAEVEALNAERVGLDFGPANAGAMELALNLAVLVAIPLAPVLGAGIGGIAAALTAAGAAAGAFGLAAIPAIKDVSAALQAQTTASKSVTKETSAQANAGNTAAQQALSMASAQQSLASAERSAASSIHSADEQVANSKRALTDAVSRAADDHKAALDKITSAQQQAAADQKAALAGVKSAEESLAAAQRDSTTAEANLVKARQTAADQLKDLQNQLADGDLSSRETALRVAQTKSDLLAAKSNPNTAPLDLVAAQLAYDQAVQANKEQIASNEALKKSATEQRKAGVDGADAVKSAAQQLADAQQNVADKTQNVADAQAKVVKVAKDSAKSIADAQDNLAKVTKADARAIADAQRQEADAFANAANTRASAADSIASAERGISAARLSASKVTVQAATAEDAYQKALDKLSPSARALFDAIAGPRGLKTAFTQWSRSLQPDVLPIFVRGVDSAKTALPGLTPLVLAFADGVTTLYDKASKELKTPFWKGFKSDIDTSAKPAVVGLGVAFGNIFKGMAGIVDAFLPHLDGIASTMDRITGRFAKWGSGLKGSPEFEGFLDYVKTSGPQVADFLGKILGAALQISKDLSPVSLVVMQALGSILDAVSWLATNAPEVVILLYGLYLGSKLFATGMALLEIALTGYNIVMEIAALETFTFAAALEITGIPLIIGLIVGAIILLGLGFYELWKHAGWFRSAMKTVWDWLKTATLFLWNDVLKPAFHGIEIGLSAIGKAAVWLWTNGIKPAFKFIWDAARILTTVLLTILITPVYILITQVLGPAFTWLWKHAIKPAFDGISTATVWLWKKVLQPTFQAIGDLGKWLYDKAIKPMAKNVEGDFKTLADAAKWLYDKAIKPSFQFIGDKATWLYDKAIKPAFSLIKTGVHLVASAFKTAKEDIGVQWGLVEGIAKKPVKFIVDHVYNQGIVPVWNGVSKVTGVGKIKPVNLKGWATGGILPGYTPGRDPHEFFSPTGGRIALSGGESIMRPEWTRGVGASFVDMMNSIARTRGVAGVQSAMGALTGGRQAFSGGGIIGSLGNFGSSVLGKAKDIAGFLDPGKLFDALLTKVKGPISQFGSTPWAEMMKKIPATLIKAIKDKALHAITGLFSAKAGGGGGDSAAHGAGPAAAQAIARNMLKAFNWGGDQMAPLIKLWNGESGWNYKALNPSSGAFGIPQALPAGKMASAGPDWRTNPATQITWGLDYISQRYHSPANAWATWLARSPHWYDEGGYLPPGESMTYNHTGKPEPVFTAGQWDVLKANIGQGRGDVHVEARVFVGDREITDIVRTEITTYDADTARDIDTGRWT